MMNKTNETLVQKTVEGLSPELRSAWDAIFSEHTEIQKKYLAALNSKKAPGWVASARKAEYDFACAVMMALPTFIFNDEECKRIAERNDYIHLCWVEWNTLAQEKGYSKGHDVNAIEDIMEIVAETTILQRVS